jgi:cell division protein FtsL
MIRTLNFAFIVITGLVCLGLYRIAEEARVSAADLKATRAAIVRESDALTVLGAEWARLTQPGRIQALVGRHLDLSDKPEAQLSSLTQLPSKNPPLVPEGAIRNAKAVVPQPLPEPRAQASGEAPPLPSGPSNDPSFALIHTGT